MRTTSTGVLLAAALLIAAATSSASSAESPYNGRTRRSDGRVRLIDNYLTAAATQSILSPTDFWVRVGNNPDPALNGDPFAGGSYGDIYPWYRRVNSPVTVGLFIPGPTWETSTEVERFALGTIRRKRLTLLLRQASMTDGAVTLEVLDETDRKLTGGHANLRVIHGIPSPAVDGIKLGALGAGCLTPSLSFPANTVVTLPAGLYTLAMFPADDRDCSGVPLPGLERKPVRLEPRTAYTAIAWVQRRDPAAFELKLQRDFCRPGCPLHDLDGDGLPPAPR